jgi:hypothetical protein
MAYLDGKREEGSNPPRTFARMPEWFGCLAPEQRVSCPSDSNAKLVEKIQKELHPFALFGPWTQDFTLTSVG